MSEFAIFVESIIGAGWMFLCALGVLALGLLTLDRTPRRKSASTTRDAAQPRERRAA